MKKKTRLIIMLASIFVLLIEYIYIIYSYIENRSTQTNRAICDTNYNKQWYLQSKADSVTIKLNVDCNNSFMANDITFNSNIDLGVLNFWNTYTSKDNKELVIAILDSCVDIYHEDLKEHIWTNNKEIVNNGIDDDHNGYIDDYYGWNFNKESSEVYSNLQNAKHATHCAGIIAATHNDVGIRGILGNTNVKLMIIPIYGDAELNSSKLISGIEYANSMGADICCIPSVYIEGQSEIKEAINSSNMLFVVAAGNFQNQYMNGLNLNEYPLFPACCNNDNVITVASINADNQLSNFSNYSSTYVDICAPGEYIYSTLPHNNYGYETGTSASVPIVAGIIGAYYYSYTDTTKNAVNLMYNNCQTNISLSAVIKNGYLVRFISQ